MKNPTIAYVIGGFTLLVWTPFALVGLATIPRSLGRADPFVVGQLIFYTLIPLLVCMIVIASLIRVYLERRKQSGILAGVLPLIYIFMMIAILPYLMMFTGGI